MNDAIYTVTTLRNQRDDARTSRTVGYYHNLEKAQHTVENNLGDLWEAGWYNFAVIEAVQPGLYPIIEERYFYKWDDEQQGYRACDPFINHKQVVAYAWIG